MRVITYLMLLTSFLFVSCESNEEKRVEFAQIVEQKDTPTLLNDLYIGADGNIASLSRILNASPSSIDRIRKGETSATPKFEERVKEVSIYYVQNEQSFSKLRSVLDDEYGWYNSVLNFPSHHPWWFWGITIVLFLIWLLVDMVMVFGLILEALIFLVAWLCMLIFSPSKEVKDDKYINNINPAIEQTF